MRDFDPGLFRPAVALVTAAAHEDNESFDAILEDAGPEVARALVGMLLGSLDMLAEKWHLDRRAVLVHCGLFAAEQAAPPSRSLGPLFDPDDPDGRWLT